jgi:hypothetical protein
MYLAASRVSASRGSPSRGMGTLDAPAARACAVGAHLHRRCAASNIRFASATQPDAAGRCRTLQDALATRGGAGFHFVSAAQARACATSLQQRPHMLQWISGRTGAR